MQKICVHQISSLKNQTLQTFVLKISTQSNMADTLTKIIIINYLAETELIKLITFGSMKIAATYTQFIL